MSIKIIPTEDIDKIIKGLDNIPLSYFNLHSDMVNQLNEEQRLIVGLVIKYNIDIYINLFIDEPDVTAKEKVIQQLNQCRIISEIFDILKNNNSKLSEVKYYFDTIENYIEDAISSEIQQHEYKIKSIKDKRINMLDKIKNK